MSQKVPKRPCPAKDQDECAMQNSLPYGNNFRQCKHFDIARYCTIDQSDKCPYSHRNRTKCPYDKKNCVWVKKKRSYKVKIHTLIAVFILFSAFVGLFFANSCLQEGSLCTIIVSLCISLISGVAIYFLIDIPNKLNTYKDLFIDTLISDNYLKELDAKRLTDLRKKITLQLHYKDIPRMAHGLIELDEKICKLLQEPYYTRYREHVICREEGDFIVKNEKIEYELINPFDGHKSRRVDVGVRRRVDYNPMVPLSDNATSEKEEGVPGAVQYDFEIKEFKISIDGGRFEDIADKISYVVKEKKQSEEFYKYEITQNRDNVEDSGLYFDFDRRIIVKLSFYIKVNKADVTFHKRLRYPTHNFRIDFATQGTDVALHGQLFGTLIEQADVTITNNGSNSISIETYNWLLPRNGVMIVMAPKDKIGAKRDI